MLTRIYSFVLGDEKKVNKSIENGEVNMGQRAKDDSRSGPSQQKQRDIGVDPQGSLTSSVNQRRRSNQAGLQRKDDGKIGGVVERHIIDDKHKILRELNDERQRNERLSQEMLSANQDAKEMKKKLKESEEERVKLIARTRLFQEHLSRSQSHGQALERQLQHQQQQSKLSKTEFQQIEAQHLHTLALLETRTSELKGTQTFLTKADSLSGAEVTTMMEGLNADILETAAFMADSFQFEKVREVRGEQKAACERVRESLGARMPNLLISIRHKDDPMLIQIALQSCLAWYCTRIIRAWCIDTHNQMSDILIRVYEDVRRIEDQAVSGRWRALTRKHVQPVVHGEMDLPSYLGPFIARSLADVLLAAGCRGNSQNLSETILGMFGERVKIITTLALRINQVFGTEVTSCDFETVCFPDDILFDPLTMDDINGGRGSPKRVDHVLCTTELGLRRVARETKGERIWLDTRILLKPKVALHSVTDGMSLLR